MLQSTAILIGLILGDGYLTRPCGSSATSSLDIKYDEKYLNYLEWLHEELADFHPSLIRRKKGFHQFRFYTKRLKEIGKFRELFYNQNGTKIIPSNIKELLTNPLTLAVWYQDDGTLDFRDKYHANALLATHCFTFEENQMLVRALSKNFNLDIRVCRCQMRGKLYFRLYVTSKSMDIFMKLVEPYVQKCFNYKLVKYRIASQQQR